MFLESDIKTIANYAERCIIWVTPNEAMRLGVKGRCSSSGNSAGVCIFFAPNRFASLGVTQIQPIGFDGRFLTPLCCVRNDTLPRGERGGIGNRQFRRRFPIPLVF